LFNIMQKELLLIWRSSFYVAQAQTIMSYKFISVFRCNT
jgi:hypothetical protein